jgi:4-hydroxybenzoate polyprenyltransferase
VRGYVLLPHLIPVLVVELATAAFAFIAWGGRPPLSQLLLLLLAMLGGQLAIGALNELVDLPFDTIGKPAKPLPRGDVTVVEAQTMVIGGLALMVTCGLPFGLAACVLLFAGTGIGIAYDLWLKRTPWSWLPYFLALPLLPIWVFTALGHPEPRLLLLYPLGALATIGVHFAQSLPDVEIDQAAGSHSLAIRLGAAAVFLFAWLAALSAPALALIVAMLLGIPAVTPIVAAVIASVLLFMTDLGLLIAAHRHGIEACFPLVALSTLAGGLAWAIAVAH